MAIPKFAANGNLPPGIHWATWNQIEERFGINEHRRALLVGLRAAVDALREAKCRTLYIDGSFVTAKPLPADYDGCWDATDVDFSKLDRVFMTFDQGRATQKARFGGELFLAKGPPGIAAETYLEFFQIDRETGEPKGIIALNPRRVR